MLKCLPLKTYYSVTKVLGQKSVISGREFYGNGKILIIEIILPMF